MAGLMRSRSTRRNNKKNLTGVLQSAFQMVSPTARDRRTRRSKVNAPSATRSRKGRATQQTSGQPPVLVRRGLQDMATPLRGAGKRRLREPRRRFDLTLNVPGAEVRLPSLPMVHFSWRIASGFLLVLMSFSLYLLLFSTPFQADILEVEGMQRLTMSDLGLILDVTGEPIVSLDPIQIRQDLLQAFPDLKEVRVSVNLPASVRLVIEERQPIVSWERSGEAVWVDQEGIVFPQRGEFAEPLLTVRADSLPLLSLPAQAEDADSALLKQERLDPKVIQVLLAMSQYMPGGAALAYDAEHGFGWSDERGWQVYYGTRLEDIEEKLVVYQAIVDRLQAEGIQPALISMEYLHAPYYRMER